MRLSLGCVIGSITVCRLCSAEIAPLTVHPSYQWDGNDGPWNSFPIRVGVPEQVVRVFPSTAVPESWVVLPGGCPPSSSPSDCNNTRGGIFRPNESTTWEESGAFSLAVAENLNYTNWNNGNYGFDQLSLGWTGTGGPTVNHQIIAGIATSQWYIGVLGINPKSVNLDNYSNPQPSLLSTLQTNGLIPSLSYGYTAGAPYRYKKVLASLTLGGYDASRFAPNDVNFILASDNTRDLLVAIHSISIDTAGGTHTALRGEPTYAFIDSTVPHIWLPLHACEAFEAAFRITWDSATDLYLVNDTLHETLLSENANVTFELGDTLTGGHTTSITLPYSSFDLSVSWPVVENTTRYFPLRRAANTTQVTLGRTFLQEAYLTVDYDRANFSVSQALFNESAPQQLVAITPPNITPSSTTNVDNSNNKTHHLSAAAIAGIVVGVVLVVAFAFSIIIRHHRGKLVQQQTKDAAEVSAMQQQPLYELEARKTETVQLDVEHKAEMDGEGIPVMAGGMPIYEMAGATPVHEMPAVEPRGPDLPGEHLGRISSEKCA